MQKNMNLADRTLRIVLALAVTALNLTGVISGLAGAVLGIFAAVFLVTGLSGFCPLYRLFRQTEAVPAADTKEGTAQ